MPDQLESIVQKMIDAGESEENIASVIKEYKQPKTNIKDYKGPTSFLSGALKSLTSGEAIDASKTGALGYLKGATLDLPAGMFGALSSIANFAINPVEATKSAVQGIPEALSSMWETTKQAGSEPEAFGRMLGQTTGQPLATAGLVKGAPAISRTAGTPIAATGRVMRKWQPVSGFLPRFAEARTLRNIERGIGGKIEQIGEWMKIPTKEGFIIRGPVDKIKEGQIIQEPTPKSLPGTRQLQEGRIGELPEGRRVFYSPESYTTETITPESFYYPSEQKLLSSGSATSGPATNFRFKNLPRKKRKKRNKSGVVIED